MSADDPKGRRVALFTDDLISDALLFGRLWYGEPNAVINAIDYTKFYS